MKKLNKKGFTIVELVIVIAVIAILAAVLIPTFTTVIAKSRASAALQTAKNALENVVSDTYGLGDGTVFAVSEKKGEAAKHFLVYDSTKTESLAAAKDATSAAGTWKIFVRATDVEAEQTNIIALVKAALDNANDSDEAFALTGTATLNDANNYQEGTAIAATYGAQAVEVYTNADLPETVVAIIK